MHALLFRLKRAFQRSLAHVRPLIADFGLTPARFDMMKTIAHGGTDSILQSSIRRVLGVSAPTVSRMLKSLEGLGFVVRTPAGFDKRERHVALTEEGRRRFDAAASELIVSGAMDISFAGALTRTPDWLDRQEHATQVLDRLDAIREGFRDGAEIYLYRISRWFCDDHPTQRPLGPRFDDEIEADDCEGICIRGKLLRRQLAYSRF